MGGHRPLRVMRALLAVLAVAAGAPAAWAADRGTAPSLALDQAGDIAGIDAQQASAFGGTYRFVSAFAGMSLSGFGRALGSGTLSVDTTNGTFSVSSRDAEMNLTEICRPQRDACARTFIRTLRSSADTFDGTFQLLGGGRIAFTTSASAADPGETVEGFMNRTGTLVVVPFARANGLDLVVAIRPESDLSVETLAGTYSFVLRAAEFPKRPVSPRGAWSSYASDIQSGTFAFFGEDFIAIGDGSKMQEDVTCTASEARCSLSAALVATPTGGTRLAGKVSVSDSGAVILEDESRGLILPGLVSEDGTLLVALEDARDDGRQGLNVMVRQGAGMSSASLDGVYNAIALEDFFDTDARIRAALVSGQLTFDGDGRWGFLGSDSSVRRVECQGTGPCPGVSLTAQTFHGATAGGTYTVDQNGGLIMIGVAADGTPRLFVGSLSGDGSAFVLRRVVDSDASSCAFDCAALQSVRSLIIAVRTE